MIKEVIGQFRSLKQNKKKYINFSVLIQKELKNNKLATYEIKFIDSLRFISGSLSSLADNIADERNNSTCKCCKSCLEYIKIIDKSFILKCLKCNKNHKKYFKEDFVKRFGNIYKLCDGDIDKFCLMLRK